MRSSPFAALVAAVTTCLAACQPGLGRQVSANDFAFAFTQRDDRTLRALSTAGLRAAVWDRLEGGQEFRRIAAILGHGQDAEVVDSQFRDREAVIQYRTPGKSQYRLYLLYQEDDWRVDDVLKEQAPGVFVSMRRQAEAVLAVRDFRRALERRDAGLLAEASSAALTRDAWQRADATLLGAPLLVRVLTETDGELGEVFEPRHEKVAARIGDPSLAYVFYFVKERGRLVVDDLALPGSDKPLRALVREGRTGSRSGD
jgi:hypothetical protein